MCVYIYKYIFFFKSLFSWINSGTVTDQNREGQAVFRLVSKDNAWSSCTYMSLIRVCTILALRTRN